MSDPESPITVAAQVDGAHGSAPSYVLAGRTELGAAPDRAARVKASIPYSDETSQTGHNPTNCLSTGARHACHTAVHSFMRPRRQLRLDSRRTVPLERFRRYKEQRKLLKARLCPCAATCR